jgi:hypothetical protein
MTSLTVGVWLCKDSEGFAGSSARDCVPVLGVVKVVPPVGGSTLTTPPRRLGLAAVEEPWSMRSICHSGRVRRFPPRGRSGCW